MNTRVVRINPLNMDTRLIKEAAAIIGHGGLVAFPTETVYGLGADATDADAVARIFAAKGRPPDNPLIIHISGVADIESAAADIPQSAIDLCAAFWPGPLTLVLKKSADIPQIVTAGLDTAAVRMPSHPVALALIEACGKPIAAPSANISGRPSPTDAGHVIRDLMGKVDMIIDAGSTPLGVESTVLDLTVSPPAILRSGGVTREQLESFLRIRLDIAGNDMHDSSDSAASAAAPRSPGMKYRHYSPAAEMIVVVGEPGPVSLKISSMAENYASKGLKTAIIATEETLRYYASSSDLYCIGSRCSPETIAASLYKTLRALDDMGYDVFIAEGIERSGVGAAVMDRMCRASGNNVIKA